MMAGCVPWLRGGHHRVIATVLFSLLVVATSALAQNTFPSSGNVGIGTTNPSQPLEVNGNAKLDTSAAGHVDLLFGTAGGPSYQRIRYDDSTGNLRFQTNLSGNVVDSLVIDYNSGNVEVNGNARFEAAANGVIDLLFGAAGTSFQRIRYDDSTGTLRFQTNLSGAAVNALVIGYNSGNVGIGTAIPTTKLHVAGDAQVDGNVAAKYQDVAEWVPTRGTLPPGTIVVIDGDDGNRVGAALRAYDTRVAGVISERPGILLGEPGEDKARVAHSGRVKVKVDASYGSIAVGDLLVTSRTPGHAMRSEPIKIGGVSIHRPGTLMGKALEPLEKGRGEILVLLTLQ